MKVRRIICIGCLLATLAAVATDSACASTLLSGYGGPGQGNQATLGASLLNGPKGGGGSRGGSAGVATSTASNSNGSEPAAGGSPGSASGSGTPTATGGRSSSGSGQGARAGGRSRRDDHGSGASAQPGQASSKHPVKTLRPSSLYPAAERIPAGESSNALGVSGSDLLYIVLTLAVLGGVAVLTRRLAGPENAGNAG
jgi:hypothetical protein